MKDKEAAIKKEIKGRAAALIGTFGVIDVLFLVMLFPLWEVTGARITLLILLVLCVAMLILGILDWIYPKTMWIEEEGKNGAIRFGVECDCKWEPEHGLAIVVYDSRIVHVGPWDGDLERWMEE